MEGFIEGEFQEDAKPQTALATVAPMAMAAQALEARDYQELLMPALSVSDVTARYEQMRQVIGSLLEEGKDFGTIPGTDGDTLLLCGAEKLATFFGLSVEVSLQEAERDRANGWFFYRFKATAKKGGVLIAQCDGVCHSEEDSFKLWVDAPAPPSKADQQYLIANKLGRWSKFGNPPVWQEKRDHPNPSTNMNNISKRAQKRAYVGVVNLATGASQFFSKGLLKKKPSTAEIGPTQFWEAVKKVGLQRQDADMIAQQAIDRKITWQQAIAQLPS